jgi:hypothetical protein
MLRLSSALRTAVAAAALLASTPLLAQGGLGGRITEAGQKLDQDSQACKPINLGEYVELLREAGQNRLRADKAKAKGVPIDETQVQADLANASALVNRAQAALVQQCMRAAQGQAQPQAQPQTTLTPTPATAPATTPGQQAGGGQGGGGTGSAIDAAEAKLDADIKACRPIRLGDYDAVAEQAHKNAMLGLKAANAGAPVDRDKLRSDMDRADKLLKRARDAEAQQKACPPKREATTETPPTIGATGRQSTMAEQAEAHPYDGPPSGYPVDWPSQSQFEGWIADLKTAYHQRDMHSAKDRLQLLDYWHDVLTTYLAQPATVDIGIRVDEFRGDLKKIDDVSKDRGLWYFLIQATGEYGGDIPKWLLPAPKAAQSEPPPPPVKTDEVAKLTPFAKTVLTAHNAARAAVGSPPLKWNPVLAEHATARAGELAKIGQLVHAPREGRGTERENILQAPLSYTTAQMMERWTSEREHYVPGLFPDVSDTGDWQDVGHWTQISWWTTTDLGCGEASGGGFTWLVCRYDPGGNKDGKPVIDPSFFVKEDARPDIPASKNDMSVLHEYGYDAGLFVGYDLGAFRIEAETAYKAADIDWAKSQRPSHMLLGGIAFNFGGAPIGPPVEQVRDVYDDSFDKKFGIPLLPPAELFDPNKPPPKLEDVM